MCYNFLSHKAQESLQLKGRWRIRERVTRQRHPLPVPQVLLLYYRELVPYPCGVSEGLHPSIVVLFVGVSCSISCCYSK